MDRPVTCTSCMPWKQLSGASGPGLRRLAAFTSSVFGSSHWKRSSHPAGGNSYLGVWSHLGYFRPTKFLAECYCMPKRDQQNYHLPEHLLESWGIINCYCLKPLSCGVDCYAGMCGWNTGCTVEVTRYRCRFPCRWNSFCVELCRLTS